jgi:hypothetical protein
MLVSCTDIVLMNIAVCIADIMWEYDFVTKSCGMRLGLLELQLLVRWIRSIVWKLIGRRTCCSTPLSTIDPECPGSSSICIEKLHLISQFRFISLCIVNDYSLSLCIVNDYSLLVPTSAHMHTATHRTIYSLLVHFKLARHNTQGHDPVRIIT